MTDNTTQILAYIILYKTENDGMSPSYREICKKLGIGLGTVTHHLNKLEREGAISFMGKGRVRNICVTGGRWSYE
jgi:DNA-binding MarR family transcriptional regulator